MDCTCSPNAEKCAPSGPPLPPSADFPTEWTLCEQVDPDPAVLDNIAADLARGAGIPALPAGDHPAAADAGGRFLEEAV